MVKLSTASVKNISGIGHLNIGLAPRKDLKSKQVYSTRLKEKEVVNEKGKYFAFLVHYLFQSSLQNQAVS